MATMEDILNETTAFVMSKQASFKTKSAIAGEDPASMPGAEHDKAAPSVGADPEVNDATMGPAETRSADGKGDDSPLTRGHATGAEEGAEPVEKKPAITDDAEVEAAPKQAAATLANDILASIHAWQKKPAVKAAAAPAAEKPAEKPAVKEAAPKATEKPAAKAKTSEKAAGGLDIELTEGVLAKMAAIALSFDEGVTFMHDILQKHAGAEAADETIGFLTAQNLEAEKQAAEAQGYKDAQEAMLQAAFDAGVKSASAPLTKEEQLHKLGQALADGSIADVMGALPAEDPTMGGGAPMPEGIPAGEMLPEEGGMEEGVGEEDYTIEDLAAALDVLVSDGTIGEDDAQQVLESIVAGDEGGGAPVEEPLAEEPPAEEPPAEEPPAEEPPAEETEEPVEA